MKVEPVLLPPGHGPDGKMESLSEDLRELLELARTRDLSLGEIVEVSHRRGLALLICLLAVPFAQPVPLPISPFFGAALAILGFRLALGHRAWLPRFVLRRRISSAVLVKVFEGSVRIAVRLERLIRPRMNFMDWPGARVLIGLHVVLGALALAMPVPGLPFSNAIPAVGILLLALGWMELDGWAAIGGAVLTWSAWVYFALSGGALIVAIRKAGEWFGL